MTTMKFCSMNGPTESEVESLLMSPCWGPTQNSTPDQYLLDGHKLLLDHDLDSLPSDNEQKNSLDVLDNLLMNSSSLNGLSDLKPLPPFTGYTGHLSINGISGHHYHAIAQRLPDESNNNYMQSAYHTTTTQVTNCGGGNSNNNNNSLSTSIQLAAAASSGSSPLPSMPSINSSSHTSGGGGSSHGSSADHNIVSSSTCLPESMLSSDADACLNDVKLFADSQLDTKLSFVADSCLMQSNSGNTHNTMLGGGGNGHDGGMHQSDQNGNPMQTTSVRIYTDAKDLTEYVDMNSIDDIAAIIGSAIADTTVANQLDKDDGTDTRDSWMDLDAWIDGNCIQHTSDGKLVVQQDSLSDFILPHSPVHHTNTSTLQSLLTHGYMPLLQNRLQNGPPNSISLNGGGGGGSIKSEAASSTSYCNDMVAATSTSSPPGSVVSTTDNLMINPRYLTNTQPSYQITIGLGDMSMKADGLCSPDLMGNYPHTTTVTTNCAPKAKRSRSQKKNSQQQQQQLQQQQQQQQQQQNGGMSNTASTTTTQLNAISPSSVSFSANDLQGLLGKEKPVHRCSICNRGFLNKSNIKVHLRTHTGEKPFRCDVCAKAFRQKAHLLKHQQMHKRIGRD